MNLALASANYALAVLALLAMGNYGSLVTKADFTAIADDHVFKHRQLLLNQCKE